MRKHIDGHLVNDKGDRAGRWDDNAEGVRQYAIERNENPDQAEADWRKASDHSDRPVVKRVEQYYAANRWRADRGHGQNWLRVLNAFGQYQERGIKPYSAAEAWESAKVWNGWEEVALALEGLESANYEFAHGYDPWASAYKQEGTKDGYIPPDSDKWLNPRQDESAPEPNAIAPEHVDQFIAYIERERDLVAEVCGTGHPAVKNREHDAYIEAVKSGEPVHSQVMFLYEQFLGWLRGEHGQQCVGERTLWADGTENDHSEAAFKAKQDAYAEEVQRDQAARDAGEPDAQQGFDEWKRPNRAMFPWDGSFYVEDARAGVWIYYEKVGERRGELTAENVRYRLDCDRPDGVRQLSWLALNYEGCLCDLPLNTEAATRMVPAEEIPDLLASGLNLLTPDEFANNQRPPMMSRDTHFAPFKLWVQMAPGVGGKALGVCPEQHDTDMGRGGGAYYNRNLFARLQGGTSTTTVEVPDEMADAIKRGDWAEVARLATERAGA